MICVSAKRREEVKRWLGLVLDRAAVNDPDDLLRLFGFRVESRPAAGDVLWRVGRKVITQEKALRLIRSVARKA